MLRVFRRLNCEQPSQFKRESKQQTQGQTDGKTAGGQYEALWRNRSFRQIRRIDYLNSAALLVLRSVSANDDLLLLSEQRVVIQFLCLVLAIDCFQADLGVGYRVNARVEFCNL